ncbi:MAG: PDZ domain-containing protein [Acidobacteria bacterium]|nr:PDZ domain-containing protein [Acidobacteriota bacterium]
MTHLRSRPIRLALALALAAGLSVAAVAHARRWGQPQEAARIPVGSGTVEISLEPDGESPLGLVAVGQNRWAFQGATQALIGQSYSVVLRNRTAERLAVVLGNDGLNAFGREPVVGRFDADVAFLLPAWSERTLPGWQVDDDRAQRFVFSPREWSEGEGRTEDAIGTLSLQVYRERRPPPRRYKSWGDRLEDDAELRRESSEPAPEAAQPQIGTTTGEEVDHRVHSVHFDAASELPEAWAVVEYGRPGAGWSPPGRPLLGIGLASASRGSRIVSVTPGSAADRAGLQLSDVIVRIDAVDEPDPGTIHRLLERKDRGDYVFLRVRRGPHELSLKIRT